MLAACLFGVVASVLTAGADAPVESSGKVESLIRDLRGPDRAARRKALEQLVDMGQDAKPAVPALIAVLDDADQLNRDYAITTLKGLGPAAAQALPALRRVAGNDASPEIRQLASEAVAAVARANGQPSHPTPDRPDRLSTDNGLAPKPPAPDTDPATDQRRQGEGLQLPDGYAVIGHTDSGLTLRGRYDAARSARAVLASAVKDLPRMLDGKPSSSRRYEGLAVVICAPTGAGQWMYYYSQVTAPGEVFQRDLPTMLQIWKSWKVSDRTLRERMDKALAEMKEAGAMLRQSQESAERVRERANADFDEVIRGYRTVEDTLTGNRGETDLGAVHDTVQKLNEHAGYERYKEIPLRDQ